MLDEVEVRTTITGDNYTFFEVIGDGDDYTILGFELCHDSSSSINELIDVWEDDGIIDTLTKENAQKGGKEYATRGGCMVLSTSFMKFGRKPSG